jgi:hypothetical protein
LVDKYGSTAASQASQPRELKWTPSSVMSGFRSPSFAVAALMSTTSACIAVAMRRIAALAASWFRLSSGFDVYGTSVTIFRGT